MREVRRFDFTVNDVSTEDGVSRVDRRPERNKKSDARNNKCRRGCFELEGHVSLLGI